MRHACKGLLLLALLIRLLACTRAANLALIRAALAGDTVAVLDLLAAGANVNAKNNDGVPALSFAAEKGHTATVQALLEAGADVNANAKNGMTALMEAQDSGQTEVVEILKNAGAKE